MASSEQLEQEAEATRARIEQTLVELRRRISPGQIADQAIDYARDSGGGDFVRHLGRQVADNPLPVALMGAGLAWLMMTPRHNGEAHERKGDGSVATTEPASRNKWDRTLAMATEFEKTSRRARNATESVADREKQTGTQASKRGDEPAESAYESSTSTASDVYGKAAKTASRAYDKASDLAGSTYERASEAMGHAKDMAGHSISSASESARGMTKFMREEPLVVAGLGVALGALIGALLPASEFENRTMGETSDQLKREAREAAREQWERGKQIAEDGWDEAKEAARRTWEDAKAEAQKSWEATQHDAGSRSDGHAGDTTGAQAPLVPSEEETKAQARGQEVRSSS